MTASGGASIVLNWTATVKTYATGYHVLRGTADGGPYTQIAAGHAADRRHLHRHSRAGTYYYVVRAYVQNWESANSNEAHATEN